MKPHKEKIYPNIHKGKALFNYYLFGGDRRNINKCSAIQTFAKSAAKTKLNYIFYHQSTLQLNYIL